MKSAIVVLLLVFSFSAHSAKESSALESLKAIPAERPQCKVAEGEYGTWKIKKQPLPKERLSRATEILKAIRFPTTDEIGVVQTALREDAAGALPFYFEHSNCGMLRRQLTSRMVDFAKLKSTSEGDKATVRAALKDVLQAQKYEMFIEAMIDASILNEVYASKLFSKGSGPAEIESLKVIKARLTREAKTVYSDEVQKSFPDQLQGDEKKDPKKFTEAIRKSPNYEKFKGRWAQEAELSGAALNEIRDLVSKLD